MSEAARILVVDDEQPIAEAIAYNLKKEGFFVQTAADAETCLELVRTTPPSLVILDIMLPSISGFDVCRLLRRQGDIPIIMLTARTAEHDRVKGLELGADDYVTKPFNMRELIARVRSVLRRTSPSHTKDETIKVGNLFIDVGRHEARLGERPLNLAPKEFDLLRFLATHPGRVFTRQTLLDRVWGTEAFVDERTVDVHIRWLREKIEEDPSNPRRLITVRGVGYKFSE
ncbi:MAG TPA: response regulator transcription factor [Chthonomonas sp.]|jgi:phosphate regulon transcriptional regulator PhoB|uniref:response regulator transcription factor n=1 Tax=Chthonomonas sp. TaxID=2282153 RepID=UPI002B4AD668|nr:response regulator transcription factor [Chthonomonas sp.]HLH79399.1 response regulator transcription factor [Chthonomonas sp.]